MQRQGLARVELLLYNYIFYFKHNTRRRRAEKKIRRILMIEDLSILNDDFSNAPDNLQAGKNYVISAYLSEGETWVYLAPDDPINYYDYFINAERFHKQISKNIISE